MAGGRQGKILKVRGAEWDMVSGILELPIWCQCGAWILEGKTVNGQGDHCRDNFVEREGCRGPEQGWKAKAWL